MAPLIDASSPPTGEMRWLAALLEVVVLALALVVGSVLAGGIASGLVAAGVLPDSEDQAWVKFAMGTAGMFVALGVYALAERRVLHAAREPILELARRPRVGQAIWWTGIGFALAIGGSALISAVIDALGQSVDEQQAVLDIVRAGWSADLVILIVAAVLCAPVAEELLFRGYFFRRLHHQAGPLLAYVGSALIFAAIHGNLSGMLTYSWLALCFAHVYRRTGRLWSAVAVHLANNATTLALLIWLE